MATCFCCPGLAWEVLALRPEAGVHWIGPQRKLGSKVLVRLGMVGKWGLWSCGLGAVMCRPRIQI